MRHETILAAGLGVAALLGEAPTARAADDIVVADFEGTSYGDWKVEGEAFGPGPARGTLPGQMEVVGFRGRGLVNSFFQGDGSTGTLTSPPFTIARKHITFLIGGGMHPGKTCLNLLVGGQIVRTATGPNDRPGGSEALEPGAWDVSDLAGKQAVLQIVDQATGGWGHINVDHIVQTDVKPAIPARIPQQDKAFTVASPYLVMPIRNMAPNQKSGGGQIQLFIDGTEVRRYDLNLAPSAAQTDWYAFFTISAYKGRKARVVATRATEEGFALVRQSDTIPGQERFYQEPHRPQFHYTQKVGWNNDPNGMVYHNGTWHLFYQHNPVGLPWGNMTWGHATSQDLVHWQQQPDKLFPKTMARGDCFSGGATVDAKNTAGWGPGTLVAFFTDTGCGESVVYSTDGGRTFTVYEQNPVVQHAGRDPKVIWYAYDGPDTPLNDRARELGGHWVMAVYDEHEKKQWIAFYASTDLKAWSFQSRIQGWFECPEIFELPIDSPPPGGSGKAGGDARDTRWILLAADAKYAVGRFDGRAFTPEHAGKHQIHWGPYYASQTFDNAPDGRRIQIGWVRVDAPGPYNQHFSFPHQLTLRRTEDGLRLFANPVREIETLRAKTRKAEPQDLAADRAVELPVGSDLLDVRLAVEVGAARSIELRAAGRTIAYDAVAGRLNGVPLKPVDGRIALQVLCDRSLTEIAGNDGRVFITDKGPAKQDPSPVSVKAVGGSARLARLEAHELRSIWNR